MPALFVILKILAHQTLQVFGGMFSQKCKEIHTCCDRIRVLDGVILQECVESLIADQAAQPTQEFCPIEVHCIAVRAVLAEIV